MCWPKEEKENELLRSAIQKDAFKASDLRQDSQEKAHLSVCGILANFLEDQISPSMDELVSAFGTPEEMARILMEETSAQDQAQFRKELLIKRVLIGTLLAAFLILTTYIYFYKEKPINVTDEILPESTQYVASNTADHSEK